ncbi:MAG: M56 family metallopeptidase [Chitinophagaceae bacterium]|nr:M56 family metallopeptidase [Chitinophagaceae bacterium]
MISGQSNFLQALGWAVLNSLWQMAFLWVLFQIITGIFRKVSSSQKSAMASSLVIVGFSWFVYTLFSLMTAGSADNGAISGVVIGAGSNDQLNNWLNTMLPIASLVYLILLVLPVFYFTRNYRYVQAIRKYELSKVDVEWRIFVKNMAARMGIKKPVHVWLSGIVTSPVTIGYIKPVILLPLAAINHLTTQQMEAILLHELSHIRRFDYLMNLIIRFIQAVLYFNPFVKALVKIVEREREKSCDEMVIQFQYDPYGYASALLTLEKANHLPKPLAVAASGRKHDLLHRIECVLGVQKKQVITFNKLAGLFAGLLCFIAFNALLILSKPSKTEESIASLTHLSSPFYFFTENDKSPSVYPVATEIPTQTIVNTAKPVSEEPLAKFSPTQGATEVEHPAVAYQFANTDVPQFINVAYTELAALRPLKDYQEAQVHDALQASRKVLEETQWKAVENKLADVASTYEKSVLKDAYEKEMKKVDWNKMEAKLRQAYDRIEWSKVNEELNKAITEIKIDSLQQAYTIAMSDLTTLQQQLCENNLTCIPDTDISLESVEQNKRSVQKAINTLIKVKAKKIVHL